MPHMAEHPLSKHGEPHGGALEGPARVAVKSRYARTRPRTYYPSQEAAGPTHFARLREGFFHHLDQTSGHVVALVLVRRLDHHTHHRLGAGGAHEHAPSALESLRLAIDG